MKGLLIFLICIFYYSDNTFIAGDNPIKISIDTPGIIKKIQSDFLKINKDLNLYRKKSREAFGFSAEGGNVIGYYDKNTLKKIHCTFYGEMGKTEADYYFNNKGLFFLYKKEVFYDKPMYLKDFKIKNLTEMRYYLYTTKVIKSIAKPNTPKILSYGEIEEELKQILNILNAA